MPYWLLENDHATYAVDWEIVHRLVRRYHLSVQRKKYSKLNTISDEWGLPKVESLDVDWDNVHAHSTASADEDFNQLAEQATRDVRGLHRELTRRVTETGRLTNAFTDDLRALQAENTSRMNSAVGGYGIAIEIAKFFRDTAADTMIVGASLATGGAAVPILAGGSVLKGWAKYEDTDAVGPRAVGAAVATGVGSFVFGAFKLGGRTLKPGEEAVITILQAKWEFGVALAEGQSVGKAMALGSLKLGGPFVDRFFQLGAVNGMIQRACVPFVITVVENGVTKNVASKLAQKVAGKVAQKQIVERGGRAGINAVGEWLSQSEHSDPGVRRSEVLENATFADRTLLTLAIVNMDKGIGRGL